MGDLKSMTYPQMLSKFRERRNESKILLPLMSHLPQNCPTLHTARSCLSIGPGPGEYDLAFIDRCLPDLKKYVAVEIDKFCASELKKNIQKKYENRVESEVYDVDIKEWEYLPSNGDPAKFDVILLSHMLYDFSPEECQLILKKCLKQWLTPKTGVLVIVHMSDSLDENGKTINVIQNLHRYFSDKMELLMEAKDVKSYLEKSGGEVIFDEKYKCQMDFREFGMDVVQLFNLYTNKNQTIDVQGMKEALHAVVPDGIGSYIAELMIVREK